MQPCDGVGSGRDTSGTRTALLACTDRTGRHCGQRHRAVLRLRGLCEAVSGADPSGQPAEADGLLPGQCDTV